MTTELDGTDVLGVDFGVVISGGVEAIAEGGAVVLGSVTETDADEGSALDATLDDEEADDEEADTEPDGNGNAVPPGESVRLELAPPASPPEVHPLASAAARIRTAPGRFQCERRTISTPPVLVFGRE